MNTLVLRPQRRSLHYALFTPGPGCRQISGQAPWEPGEQLAADALSTIRARLKDSPAAEAVAVHSPYGGDLFPEPVIVGDDIDARLKAVAPGAPIHIPRLQALVRACRETFAGAPIVLVFETAFCSGLPDRERGYAIAPDTSQKLGLRRYGYHGILHEAACWYATHLLARASRRKEADRSANEAVGPCRRILSVCLDDRPEIAAVIDSRPVMVTGGVTPLEGLPGRTLCGEIDPGIVLSLASEHGWGPEQINTTLTAESGLLGLTGEATDLDTVFAREDARFRLARQVMRHRILLACGAGIAAMGGLDAVVFSGTSRKASLRIARWLKQRLGARLYGPPPRILFYRASLDRAIAQKADHFLRLQRSLASHGESGARAHVAMAP